MSARTHAPSLLCLKLASEGSERTKGCWEETNTPIFCPQDFTGATGTNSSPGGGGFGRNGGTQGLLHVEDSERIIRGQPTRHGGPRGPRDHDGGWRGPFWKSLASPKPPSIFKRCGEKPEESGGGGGSGGGSQFVQAGKGERVDLRCDEGEVTTAAGRDKLLLFVRRVPFF